MATISDDFNDRLYGETLNTTNSVFEIEGYLGSSGYPIIARYLNNGRTGRSITQAGSSDDDAHSYTRGLIRTQGAMNESSMSIWIRMMDFNDGGTLSTKLYSGGGEISITSNGAVTKVIPVIGGEVKTQLTLPVYNDYYKYEILNAGTSCTVRVTSITGTVLASHTDTYDPETSVYGVEIELRVSSSNQGLIHVDDFEFTHDTAVLPPVGNALRWDANRDYSYGVDRGVLYLSDATGVAWSGITSVEVNHGQGPPIPLYLDGVKYLDEQNDSDLMATLNAFTFPDEFEPFDGLGEIGNGVVVDGQPLQNRFSLSWRTKNSQSYQIHILYDLVAVSADKNYETMSDLPTLVTFSWQLHGIPQDVPGFKPTEYFILDSSDMDPDLFTLFEKILYGTPDGRAYLPPIGSLVDFALSWDPHTLTLTSSGIHELDPQEGGDLTPSAYEGFWIATPRGRLKSPNNDGIYTLE